MRKERYGFGTFRTHEANWREGIPFHFLKHNHGTFQLIFKDLFEDSSSNSSFPINRWLPSADLKDKIKALLLFSIKHRNALPFLLVFFISVTNIRDKPTYNENDLLGLIVSEFSVHSWLAPLLWICGEAVSTSWQEHTVAKLLSSWQPESKEEGKKQQEISVSCPLWGQTLLLKASSIVKHYATYCNSTKLRTKSLTLESFGLIQI